MSEVKYGDMYDMCVVNMRQGDIKQWIVLSSSKLFPQVLERNRFIRVTWIERSYETISWEKEELLTDLNGWLDDFKHSNEHDLILNTKEILSIEKIADVQLVSEGEV